MKHVVLGFSGVASTAPHFLEETELPHYLVNICHRHHIKTVYMLIKEFEEPSSKIFDALESLDIAKLADLLIKYDVLSSTNCLLAQEYQFSKN